MEIDMDNCNNACKYFIELDTREKHCNHFDQLISKLLNNDKIDERIEFRKNLMNKIRGLHDMIKDIVHKYDCIRDRYGIKATMDETVNQFRSMFLLLIKNEVINEDSIDDCIAILKHSIYLTNECVKDYIINTIIRLTVNIDNNEKTQEIVIKFCENKFNSFNSFVENYKNAFVLIKPLKDKYEQSKINQ